MTNVVDIEAVKKQRQVFIAHTYHFLTNAGYRLKLIQGSTSAYELKTPQGVYIGDLVVSGKEKLASLVNVVQFLSGNTYDAQLARRYIAAAVASFKKN